MTKRIDIQLSRNGFARRDLMRLAIAGGTGVVLPWLMNGCTALGGTSAVDAQRLETDVAKGTKVVLLGTKAGPTPCPTRAQPANVLLVDGRPYVIDCGSGVALQLMKAGVRLPNIRDIFITHHHSDHNADMGNLVFLAWGSGLKTPVHIYGPPHIRRMMDDFLDMNSIDIAARTREEGRPPLKPLIYAHEFDKDGVVLQDDKVKVTAALVDHLTVKPAFAYRFDTKDRSVVFSGDTTYNANLIRLAQGADVLVHEVVYMPAIYKFPDISPELADHLLRSHTTPEQLGKVAAKAGVKTLVLSHLAPGCDPSITDEMWTAPIRKEFSGQIIVGKDLMVI